MIFSLLLIILIIIIRFKLQFHLNIKNLIPSTFFSKKKIDENLSTLIVLDKVQDAARVFAALPLDVRRAYARRSRIHKQTRRGGSALNEDIRV